MRYQLVIAVLIGVAGVAQAASPQCDTLQGPYRRPACDTPCPTPRDVPTPRDIPSEEQTETRETGAYVAPPRVGSTQGPMERVGVEGFSITLPELKLRMPRIELPSCFRTHTEARMMIDRAEAPYVRTGTQTFSTRSTPREAPEDCEEKLRRAQEQLRELQQQAADLQRQLDQRSSGQPGQSNIDSGPRRPMRQPTPPPEIGNLQRSGSLQEESQYGAAVAQAAYMDRVEEYAPVRQAPSAPAARLTRVVRPNESVIIIRLPAVDESRPGAR